MNACRFCETSKHHAPLNRTNSSSTQDRDRSPDMSSPGSEDGEIVGEVNDNYNKADYVHPAAKEVPGQNSSRAASLSLLAKLVPGWADGEDEPEDTNGTAKRKPKKEKKQRKGKQVKQAAAAALSPHQQQAAQYRAFYGAKVRTHRQSLTKKH